MTAQVLERLHDLYDKAVELLDKGHLVRAAENFGRAAEVSRALGADSLVTAFLQLRQGNTLCVFVCEAAPETAHTLETVPNLAPHLAECIALYAGAVEALERRRVEDTLMPGKCAAAEEAWLTGHIRRVTPHVPAAAAAGLGALVGYEQFMRAAGDVSAVLLNAGPFSPECSAAQLQAFAAHVVQATVLMQLPRRHSDFAMGTEAKFINAFSSVVDMGDANGLDERLVQLLTAAWQRLQHSGVLPTRHLELSNRLEAPKDRAFKAAVQESLNAPGLRSCALDGCSAKEAHPAHFKRCAACSTVVYCSKEHQVAGWPSHKKACKAACKAAAAADEAGPSGA